MSYISSNENRFYAAIESSYGQAGAVTDTNRFPATHVKAAQTAEVVKRIDKTGTRTYQGSGVTGRCRTVFEVRSYLSVWNGAGEPGYGPLFRAACGAPPDLWAGVLVDSVTNSLQIRTSLPHGLATGGAVSWSNEIRFVTAVLSPDSFTINAPFSTLPVPGGLLGPTITYRLSSNLPSVTVYDYWSAQSGISRVLPGCAVTDMDLAVNGDYHEFKFSGPCADLLDGISFTSGSAGLVSFPSEPNLSSFNGAAVPGHLGQAWLGMSSHQFFTLTEAKVQLRNNLDLRRDEFGLIRPAAVIPGERDVLSSFSLFVQDDEPTRDLYRAAKSRLPFPAMLQLGTQQGQVMGIYLPSVTADIPLYNDNASRLAWEFHNGIAQGASDDELFIAFA